MRDRQRSRRCESCQAPMARQDESCWRCGAVSATHAVPADDGSSLRDRTADVLDTRARRRAASARRDRHTGTDTTSAARRSA